MYAASADNTAETIEEYIKLAKKQSTFPAINDDILLEDKTKRLTADHEQRRPAFPPVIRKIDQAPTEDEEGSSEDESIMLHYQQFVGPKLDFHVEV